MTTRVGIKQSLAKRLKASALIMGVSSLVAGTSAMAGTADQAKRIHERLNGTIPSSVMLNQMQTELDNASGGSDQEQYEAAYRAALMAIENPNDHSFYNVTLKNLASPWTNRDFDVFAPLNDYTATVIGLIADEADFRTVLYDDVLYTVDHPSVTQAYTANETGSPDNNSHYVQAEENIHIDGSEGVSLKLHLDRQTQSDVITALQGGGASGVVTSRAGARAFLIAGTNRAAFRFTLVNHLCLDMENVHDTSRSPDRIRQDVSRSPGGDSTIFLGTCIGCHSGMDPLAQALAYHHFNVVDRDADPTGASGTVEYTPGEVQPKYFNNEATFPFGFRTPNDDWVNYWREGQNSALGWDATGLGLPNSGTGASSMFRELSHTRVFAQCHVQRAFKTVCMRDPEDGDDVQQVNDMVDFFLNGGSDPRAGEPDLTVGNMKHVFAQSAAYCKGN